MILRAEVNRPDLRWPFPANMADRLTGRGCCGCGGGRNTSWPISTAAKRLDPSRHVGADAGLGRPFGPICARPSRGGKHDHVVFTWRTARASPSTIRAGSERWTCGDRSSRSASAAGDLGPEPLGNSFDEPYLVGSADRPQNTDQGGACWIRNRRRPWAISMSAKPCFDRAFIPRARPGVSKARISRLVPIIRTVLSDAIEAGGSSLRDYRQADGELGYFQHSFDVYGREGAPAGAEGCTVDDPPHRSIRAGRPSTAKLSKIA